LIVKGEQSTAAKQTMIKKSIKLSPRASISLHGIIQRRKLGRSPLMAARAAGFLGADPEVMQETDPTAVLVEAADAAAVAEAISSRTSHAKQIVILNEHLLSLQAGEEAVALLLQHRGVRRIQTNKRKQIHLDHAAVDTGLYQGNSQRSVVEDGTGVLIGIVDSGFDLSHPMFRDASGNLRVEGLLWQRGNQAPRQFNTAQLDAGWNNGTNPGADENGHGTHVASIAGGSRFGGMEGVAPGSRFLLVKTDFVNTDKAVRWIYDRAGNQPCVINMSLGHHWGAHDGTDVEERYHAQLAASNAGKVICISAGNEREDALHMGGRFSPGQEEVFPFSVFRAETPGGRPQAALTLWHDENDVFTITLVTQDGTEVAAPAIGQMDEYQAPVVTIQLGRQRYAWSKLVQTEVTLDFIANAHPVQDLQGWKIKVRCETAAVGRLDVWFANSGMGQFLSHSMLEQARTIGLSATGEGCIAVASHVSNNVWTSDAGPQSRPGAVLGRSSNFSSLGPTRDGRWKPEISAPGEIVTAALATGSELAGNGFQSYHQAANRLLSIQGTSMSSPMIAGVVALMLQKKPTLTTAQVRDLLRSTARRDAHTGLGDWHPAYGYGKVRVAGVLAAIA
jgi:subtilisin family serine protease